MPYPLPKSALSKVASSSSSDEDSFSQSCTTSSRLVDSSSVMGSSSLLTPSDDQFLMYSKPYSVSTCAMNNLTSKRDGPCDVSLGASTIPDLDPTSDIVDSERAQETPTMPPTRGPTPSTETSPRKTRVKQCAVFAIIHLVIAAAIVGGVTIARISASADGGSSSPEAAAPETTVTAPPTLLPPSPTLAPTLVWERFPETPKQINYTAISWSDGLSMSIDGNILAIRSPYYLEDTGAVYVYKFDVSSGNWSQFGNILQGEQAGGMFGKTTDLSNDGRVLAVGSPGHSLGKGRVQVFAYGNEKWNPMGQPLDGDDMFGSTISLSADGRRLAVGVPLSDVGGMGDDVGRVKVFAYNWGTDRWEGLGRDLLGDEAFEKFGFATAFAANGDVLAVGAPFYGRHRAVTGEVTWEGRVKIFRYDSTITDWILWGDPILSTGTSDRSGWSVDLSANGEIVAVGAPLNDTNGEASGQVSVYEFDSSSQKWERMGDPIQGQEVGRWFGRAVCLSSTGTAIEVFMWCSHNLKTCSSLAARLYGYDWSRKLWVQYGRDLPGPFATDPAVKPGCLPPRADQIIMTSGNGTIVEAYRPDGPP